MRIDFMKIIYKDGTVAEAAPYIFLGARFQKMYLRPNITNLKNNKPIDHN